VKKLSKKNHETYDALMRKVEEILVCEDVEHYKNLRAPLRQFKRVHIKGPYVLIFKYLSKEDKVVFFDLDHHDKIYAL